jgi:adenylate cyclase
MKLDAEILSAGTEPAVSGEASPGKGEVTQPFAAWTLKLRGFLNRADLLRLLRRLALGRLLGLCLLVPLMALRVWDPAPLEILRVKVFDLYQLANPRQPIAEPVVIVDIDEESLAEIGQWPWPRIEVARMVDHLRLAGVVAIAFDIAFPEPDRTSPGVYADSLVNVEPGIVEALRALPSNDEVLARALSRTRLVLGQSGYHRTVRGKENLPRSEVPLAIIGEDPRPYLYRFPTLVRNTPILEEAAISRAVFNLVPSNDGVVRSVPAFVVAEDQIVPSLAAELLRIASGGDAFAIKTDSAGIRSFVVAGVEVPTDRHGHLWIHYAKQRPQLYISAKDLLAGEVASERLAGKLVLIGTSAVGLLDIKATPLQQNIPGVEVHAQVLEMILSGQLLQRPHYALGAELIVLAIVSLLIIAFVPVLGAALTTLLGAIVAAALLATSWFLFTSEGLLIDAAYPSLGSFAVFALLVFTNYLREEGRREQVRSAFRHYLSPALVDQLANEPDRLVLGGESREMTILFSDVRGFTAISERLQRQPQLLTRLMNRLLTSLTAEIMANNGTIDKYMGDAVMAFWNAPLSDADHALNACTSALSMFTALDRLNAEMLDEAGKGTAEATILRIGVGINSGLCVVGNMGSEQRFDYSVLGDAVNLASRLEGQSSTYGADIILGQATAEAVGSSVTYVELDLIRVKGKREPQRIFALLGGPELIEDADVRSTIAMMNNLLTAYRLQAWDAAAQASEALSGRRLSHVDLETFRNLYRRRIEQFRSHPPPPAWDGVHSAETK